MLDKSPRPYADDDEDALLAAAMAAVAAYIRAEEEERASRAASQPTAVGWASEALLEGTGSCAKVVMPTPEGVRKNLWLSAGLRLICGLLLAVSSQTQMLTQAGAAPAGTPPEPAPAPYVQDMPVLLRVGIVPEAKTLSLGVPDGAKICDRQSGQVVASLAGQGRWSVAARQDALAFSSQSEQSLVSPAPAAKPIRPVAFPVTSLPHAGFFQLPLSPVPASTPANSLALPLATTASSRQNYLPRVAGPASAPRVATPALAPALSLPPVSAPGAPGQAGYVIVPPQPDGLVAVNGRLYRGLIWVQSCPGQPQKICAVNVVSLEDYLLSVVPAEMPSVWPAEALKAQAIVARSYALANRGKYESRGFDVMATAEDQVYSGISGETAPSNQAVADTDGIVLTHQGKPVSAFFHSTSGGVTEVSEYVWGSSAPYLQSVPDYDDASPHFSWLRRFSVPDLDKALLQPGADVGEVLGMFVISRSPSSRARQVLVVGSRDTKLLRADTVRRLLKLPSTNFNVGSLPDCYEFAGRGFGHGLGMSQWGAKALADRGYNAAQILKYYYKDVALDYDEALRRPDENSVAASFSGQ